jgi:hypothetical protein
MTDQHEPIIAGTDGIESHGAAETRPDAVVRPDEVTAGEPSLPETVAATASAPEMQTPAGGEHPEGVNGAAARRWHAEAGRKGARRVHQLIQEGRLYEQEHGLKRGRQRLRQLIELGKAYEREHGLRPGRPTKRPPRAGREEVLATFLGCLLRMARPSFRGELLRLAEALQGRRNGDAA